MEYIHKNNKGESVKLPIRVKRAATHQDVYANGALGGALANYHFRIDFYRDQFPPAEYVVENKQVRDDSVNEVERQILTSVYISIPFLKELRNWLDKHINNIEKQYGEVPLPKSDDEAENTEPIPQAKEA